MQIKYLKENVEKSQDMKTFKLVEVLPTISPAISLVVSRIIRIETIFHASAIFLIMGFPTFLHVLDVSVNNSSEDIHYKTQYVQRVELTSAKSEEANNSLNDRFGDPHHTRGQSGTN